MINVNEIIQQTRAEVLAACINHVEQWLKKQDILEARVLLASIIVNLKEIQPAASALEELLREAELEGLDFCHSSRCYSAGKGNKPNLDYPCCFIGKRIAELGQARAILEKP